MPLSDVYVQTPNQLADFFQEIRRGQAPDQFTIQHLKDLGFRSTNHRAFIPLLKALGFLTADGKPTARYHDYRDASQSRRVMGEALKEAFSDIFVLREKPSDPDRALVEGKFKSAHNVADRPAKLMASTFYALLGLADVEARKGESPADAERKKTTKEPEETKEEQPAEKPAMRKSATSLHYNIQIHLPATKDIEVFNAIFKSLKEHLLE